MTPKAALDPQARVDVFTNGKGGIGKSLGAALLGQYLMERHFGLRMFDLDPTNATLFGYKGLPVTHVNVTEGNRIDRTKFDPLANQLVASPGPFVIDTGATVFLSFWHYVTESEFLEFLCMNGKRVIVHCPIMGGQELAETVKGLAAICEVMPPASVVVWLNSFHGPIRNDEGKPFEEFKVARDNADKLLGIVKLPDDYESLRGKALQELAKNNRTFTEELKDANVGLKERHLLSCVRAKIYEQLEAIGL